MNKKNIKLFILAICLIIFYLISFLPFFSGKNNLKKSQTAFLNQKNAQQIANFSISDEETILNFINNNNLWIATSQNKDSSDLIYFLPDKQIIQKNLNNLQEISTIYTVQENLNNLNSYGLDENQAIKIEYTTLDGSSSKIQVGQEDFSKNFRYILINQNNKIYKTNFNFSELLHTQTRFWYEPYIIPRIFNDFLFTDIQKIEINDSKDNSLKNRIIIPKEKNNLNKLLELRHGSICKYQIQDEKNKVLALQIEFGQNNYLQMDFYNDSKDFIVNCKTKIINYSFYISSWTFNSILEELKSL